jgi:hypothetical protein
LHMGKLNKIKLNGNSWILNRSDQSNAIVLKVFLK